MILISIDIGTKHSGIAIINHKDGFNINHLEFKTTLNMLHGGDGLIHQLTTLHHQYHPHHILVESQLRSNVKAMKMMHYIEAYCHIHHIPLYHCIPISRYFKLSPSTRLRRKAESLRLANIFCGFLQLPPLTNHNLADALNMALMWLGKKKSKHFKLTDLYTQDALLENFNKMTIGEKQSS